METTVEGLVISMVNLCRFAICLPSTVAVGVEELIGVVAKEKEGSGNRRGLLERIRFKLC